MTESFGVFAGTPVTEDTVLARWIRQLAPSGVVPSGADADDRLQVTADGTAEITIRPGYCLVGGYWYRSTEDVLETPEPNTASQARTDLVVVRADPTAGSSVEPGEAGIAIVEGTPGSSAPSPTREPDGVWEVPLAEIEIAGGSDVVNSGAVTDAREYTGYGAVKRGPSDHTDLGVGGLQYDTSTGILSVHTGRVSSSGDPSYSVVRDPTYPTAWTDLPLVGDAVHKPDSPLGYRPRYRRLSATRVELRGIVGRSGGAAFSAPLTLARMPSGLRPQRISYFVGASEQISADGANTARLEVQPDGDVRVFLLSGYNPDWISLDSWIYETE